DEEGHSSMSPEEQYRQASAQAERRKAELLSSAAAVKARIAPARLKQDVRQKAAESLAEGGAYIAAKATQRPVAVGAAAGALLLYVFRRPLSALFGRIYVRLTDRPPLKHRTETSETDDG
ncbi:MAG TPA: hypothetical protein VF442_04720, partial [Sphingobium sp.]